MCYTRSRGKLKHCLCPIFLIVENDNQIDVCVRDMQHILCCNCTKHNVQMCAQNSMTEVHCGCSVHILAGEGGQHTRVLQIDVKVHRRRHVFTAVACVR